MATICITKTGCFHYTQKKKKKENWTFPTFHSILKLPISVSSNWWSGV